MSKKICLRKFENFGARYASPTLGGAPNLLQIGLTGPLSCAYQGLLLSSCIQELNQNTELLVRFPLVVPLDAEEQTRWRCEIFGAPES